MTVSFDSPEAFRDCFKTCYGPTIVAYAGIEEDPERVAALDHALARLARRHDRGTARTVMDWEYLLVTGTRHEPDPLTLPRARRSRWTRSG